MSTVIGAKVVHRPWCANSLEWAKQEIGTTEHGTLFLADQHDSARGRQGRTWYQADGQLLLTLVLKPSADYLGDPFDTTSSDEEATQGKLGDAVTQSLINLTMALTLGLHDVLKEFGVVVKWPNDFLFEGKKLGGMIVENVWQGDHLEGVILGAGFNINGVPDDPEVRDTATSLAAASGHSHDIDKLRDRMCTSIQRWYQVWASLGGEVVYKEWLSRQWCLGKTVTIHDQAGNVVEGVAKKIAPDGSLTIEGSDGGEKTIVFSSLIDIQVSMESRKSRSASVHSS